MTRPIRRVVVAGVTGFIGGAVAAAFAASDASVACWSRTARQGATQVDYTDVDALAQRLREARPDLLVMAAGAADVRGASESPIRDYQAAVEPWVNTLNAVLKSGRSPQVILISSGAVFGQPAHLPVCEATPRQPISPYGYHRYLCELLAQEFADCFNMDVRVARVFSTYGPRQQRLLVWELAKQLLEGHDHLVLRGTGLEQRDYLHVDDLAARIVSLANHEGATSMTVNLASGRSVTTGELAECLLAVAGMSRRIVYQNQAQLGNPDVWAVDVEPMKAIHPEPARELEAGLAQCWSTWSMS